MAQPEWPLQGLSRREREIMDIVYRRVSATAAEIAEDLVDPPSYGAVRTMLRRLEGKGHLRHRADGPRYVYDPTVPAKGARRAALTWVANTFFGGSAARAAAAAMDEAVAEMSDEDFERLAELVEKAREGRS